MDERSVLSTVQSFKTNRHNSTFAFSKRKFVPVEVTDQYSKRDSKPMVLKLKFAYMQDLRIVTLE